MSDIAIKVENLSKRYRIGLKDEMPDTLVGAVTQAIKRPLRNLRRLRRLTTFDDGRTTTDEGRQTNDQHSSFVNRQSSAVRTDVGREGARDVARFPWDIYFLASPLHRLKEW